MSKHNDHVLILSHEANTTGATYCPIRWMQLWPAIHCTGTQCTRHRLDNWNSTKKWRQGCHHSWPLWSRYKDMVLELVDISRPTPGQQRPQQPIWRKQRDRREASWLVIELKGTRSNFRGIMTRALRLVFERTEGRKELWQLWSMIEMPWSVVEVVLYVGSR